jgi:DNA-binding NarL/FixJ family response regulator
VYDSQLGKNDASGFKGNNKMTVRILLVDDHDIVRAGIRTILEEDPAMEVVGEAEDGRSAVEMAGRLMPAVVIMDITMPVLNGLEAARQIVSGPSAAKVITLSVHSDRQYVVQAFKAGASGYLLKKNAMRELAPAIQAVTSGKAYVSPSIADVVLEDYIRHVPATDEAFDMLTEREREVLQLLSEGKTSKEIATILHLSPKTIEFHRAQLMERINIHTVAELTKYALRHGLTSLDG